VSYIDKNSNVVISARLTDKGRQLLSKGFLTFDTFRLGDSEIDYTTLGSGYDISLNNTLRAKSNNPKIKTPLFPTPTSEVPDLAIPTLQDNILLTIVDSPELGFFESGSTIAYTAQTTDDYGLQFDTIIPLSGLTGSTNVVPVLQSPSYGLNDYEPTIGDFMLVKMSNDELLTNPDQSQTDVPVPYLWYKIQDLTGSLSANTLTVELDRDFAYFPGYTGSNFCWVSFYPSNDTQFSTGGFYNDGKVWNMNNVWSYNNEGVILSSYEGFESYGSENFIGSKEYYGYTSEIQNPEIAFDEAGDPLPLPSFCEWVNSISIIHYTNEQTCDNQTEKKLGQKFYIDNDLDEHPKLVMPTLMWHRELTGNTIGHTFTSFGEPKFVTLNGEETDIVYHDLVDEFENPVGRVFPQLHTFTVDDQELVAALSYKSNRNWTLPKINVELESSNDGVLDGTQTMYVTYMLASNTGYTTGLHSKYIVCANFDELGGDCPPTENKALRLSFPSGQLPFMEISGGTGWYADRLYAIVQRTPIDVIPTPENWSIIDLTGDIVGHTVGDRIDKTNLENSSFLITNTLLTTSATTYNLHDFINIPLTSEPNLLQFGDERFFYGNVRTKGVTTKYRTKFNFTIAPTQFNISTNPTYPDSGQNIHISEVGVYSGGDLVAIGKLNVPIEKTTISTVIIEMAFDL
jgi:hypothetical protein